MFHEGHALSVMSTCVFPVLNIAPKICYSVNILCKLGNTIREELAALHLWRGRIKEREKEGTERNIRLPK